MKKLFLGKILLFVITSAVGSENVLKNGTTLYDNGPIVTSTATGVGGLNESVLENNTLSMTSFGTAHHPAANLRVADDFTVTAAAWQINSIDFYAYQTNEVASTITAINLQIWDGEPGAVGSNIVFGDSITNRLNTTGSAGILRVNEDTQGSDDARQVAITNVLVDIELPTGTYWLDWQSQGSGPSGPFVPHITIPGQTTTGNALLSTDNGASFSNLQDLGTLTNQGLPYLLNGSVISGQQPQAVPVLNIYSTLLMMLLMVLGFYINQRRTNH